MKAKGSKPEAVGNPHPDPGNGAGIGQAEEQGNLLRPSDMKVSQVISHSFFRRSRWAGYLLAVVLTGVTLLARVMIGGRLEGATMIVFTVPIVLSAYWGGLGPGLLATGLSMLGVDYFVLQPVFSFKIVSMSHRMQELVLFLTGGLVSSICELFHRAQSRVERLLAERWPVEAAVRASEERYRGLFENMVEGYAYCQMIFENGEPKDWIYLSVNPMFEKLTGLKDVVGKPASEVIPGIREKDPELIESYGRVATTGKPERFERYVESLQQWFDLSVYSSKQGFFVAVFDVITERKRAEKVLTERTTELAKERLLLRSMVDSLPDYIFVKDAQSRFVLANTACVHQLGAGRVEEVLGKTDADFVSPELAAQYLADEQALMRSGQPVTQEEVTEHKETGQVRRSLTTKVPLKDEAGNVVGVIGISRDITERKQAEEAMRRNREEFEELFDNAPVGFHEIDTEGRIVRINNTELKMLGYTAGELLGQFVWKLSADEEKSRKAALAKLGGTLLPPSEGFERLFRRKDGSIIPVWINDQILKREDGVITGTRAAIQDITEKNKVEAELNQERDLWRTLLDTSPDHIYFKDTQSRFIKSSKSQSRQFGVESPDEMVGKTDFDYFKEAHARPAFEAEQEIICTGQPIIGKEDREVWNDGHVTWASSTKLPMRDAAGKIIGIMGISRDITDHKLAEEALKREEALLTDLLDSIPDHIYFKDRQSRFIRINGAMAEHFGLHDAAEALGKTDFDMFSEEHARKAYTDEQRIMETGEPLIGFEERETWPDGRVTWVSTTKMPLRGEGGVIAGLVGISRDITASKTLEEQLRQAQKMEAIGQLAGGVAHDFNNILGIILMQADLLKTDAGLTAGQLEIVSGIGNTAQRAAGLTRQLLMFSRKQTMQLRDLDLNDSVNDMTKMLRRTLGEHVELQFKFAMQKLFIHADAGMMDQVLMNLAVNARDAMPKGGRLVIETSAVDFDETVHSKSARARPGSFVCLSVSDTGCGIPPENLPRIFEPFFTTKDVGKGTGLGLATVFGIAQQHQGWINVYSEVGHGTTFRIYLPRLAGITDQKPEQPALSAVHRGNETILLVEDEAFLRASVRKSLSQLGYRVIEAVNGIEAVEIWKQHPDEIKLLLTDMVMPGGVTGKELAERLLTENTKLKVIYTSGYSAEVAGTDFPLEEGVNFLTKPFAAQQLAQTVRNRLDKI